MALPGIQHKLLAVYLITCVKCYLQLIEREQKAWSTQQCCASTSASVWFICDTKTGLVKMPDMFSSAVENQR